MTQMQTTAHMVQMAQVMQPLARKRALCLQMRGMSLAQFPLHCGGPWGCNACWRRMCTIAHKCCGMGIGPLAVWVCLSAVDCTLPRFASLLAMMFQRLQAALCILSLTCSQQASISVSVQRGRLLSDAST